MAVGDCLGGDAADPRVRVHRHGWSGQQQAWVFLQANLSGWDWYPGAALVIGAGGVADEFVVNTNRWQIAGNAQAVEDVKRALRNSTVG